MTALETAILKSLSKGPRYVRSFPPLAKPLIERLIGQKKIVRVSGPNNKARNMIALPEKF